MSHSTGSRNGPEGTFELEMGAVFREIGLFYYIRKRARPFGKAGSIPPRVPLSAQPSRATGSGSYGTPIKLFKKDFNCLKGMEFI